MPETPSREDRIAGGLWGLLVGDALGVPYEFHDPDHLPPLEEIELEPPARFTRAHRGVPAGTYSDDGAQALCLLASLLHRGTLDVDDLGRRFVNWHDNGYLAVDGRVFDVGIQTAGAISSLRSGTPALKAGPATEQDNGNGSLMRVLPLALWHQGADAELARDAMLQSRVTHGHVRAQVCCALYCLWARRTLEGAADAWEQAVAGFRSFFSEATPERRELETVIRPDAAAGGKGSGYVVDSLHSARYAAALGSYEAVVKGAVSLGHDTDTTAAIAGGIAGIRDGFHAIPPRWRDNLRGQEEFKPLLQRLLKRE